MEEVIILEEKLSTVNPYTYRLIYKIDRNNFIYLMIFSLYNILFF